MRPGIAQSIREIELRFFEFFMKYKPETPNDIEPMKSFAEVRSQSQTSIKSRRSVSTSLKGLKNENNLKISITPLTLIRECRVAQHMT